MLLNVAIEKTEYFQAIYRKQDILILLTVKKVDKVN